MSTQSPANLQLSSAESMESVSGILFLWLFMCGNIHQMRNSIFVCVIVYQIWQCYCWRCRALIFNDLTFVSQLKWNARIFVF